MDVDANVTAVMAWLADFWTAERLTAITLALLVLGVFWALGRSLGGVVHRLVLARSGKQEAMLARRFCTYAGFAVGVAAGARVLGVEITVVLAPLVASAGVLTVAVGFASQTSASNLISGLFLLGERPFVVGDVIRVGEDQGEVVSIDLLSVKLRTFDNLLVRIPNETLLKVQVTNVSRYPIRRFDLLLSVRYSDDLDKVKAVLQGVADGFELVLDEPKPVLHFLSLASDGVNLQWSVWAAQASYLDVKNGLVNRVLRAFDASGIVVPFPQRVLWTEQPLSVTGPASSVAPAPSSET